MHEPSQARPALAAVPHDERTRALARYKIIQPHVEQGVPLAHLVHQQGIALRTAQRWVALHRQYGLAGLAHRARRDRGHQRGLRPELKQVIEGFALRNPPPTVAFVHRQVSAVALRHGWRVPT